MRTAIFERFLGKSRSAAAGLSEKRTWSLLGRLGKESWETRERLYFALREKLQNDHDSIQYAVRIYRKFFLDHARVTGSTRPPGAVLEIGPGRNLAIALLALSSGVDRYAGVDLNSKLRSPQYWFYDRLLREIEADPSLLVGAEDAMWEQAASCRSLLGPARPGGEVEVGDGRLDYRCPCDAGALPFADASFDYAFSNAVFEHAHHPGAVIRELGRVLRPGAVTIHKIDFKYHRDPSKPLTHLTFGPEEYEERKRRHGWTNRWRRPDYVSSAKACGFEVLEATVTSRTRITRGLRASLHPEFRHLPESELSALGMLLVLRSGRMHNGAGTSS